MITLEEAKQKVLALVGTRTGNRDLVVTSVVEKPYGWVLHYNSKEYAETGDPLTALVGQGPTIVTAADGAVHEFGSRIHPDIQIAEFEARLASTR